MDKKCAVFEMGLELHIWGPAFGLPSIDPECLAATAYLQSVLPNDEWILVAAYNPSWSPTGCSPLICFLNLVANSMVGDFPALKNGLESVGGYNAIINCLEAQDWSLNNNASRTREQSADFVALV